MKINTGCYLKKGYTLVEVLTASGIFSILLVAVFQFYRMGSLMFNSGSWRQSTQKKAEQFTYLLEKRMNRERLIYTNKQRRGKAMKKDMRRPLGSPNNVEYVRFIMDIYNNHIEDPSIKISSPSKVN